MMNLRARLGGKRRPLLLLLAVALLFLSSLLAYAFTRPAPDGPKPILGLMTTLPLQWSDYQPLYRTPAGTGVGAAFALWGAA